MVFIEQTPQQINDAAGTTNVLLKNGHSQLAHRMDQHESDLDTIRSNGTTANTHLSAIETAVEGAEADLALMVPDLDATRVSVASVDTKLTTTNADLALIKADIAAVKASVASLDAVLQLMKPALDSVQQAVEDTFQRQTGNAIRMVSNPLPKTIMPGGSLIDDDDIGDGGGFP